MAFAETVCIEAPYTVTGPAEQRALGEIARTTAAALARFPSLAEVFQTAEPELCTSTRMDGAAAYLDVAQNRIVIDTRLSPDMKAGVLLHEIRHLWQDRHGVCPSDDLAMREFARATFALEADASAISLLVAWDMLENGKPGVWEALSGWDTQRDIAASFADTILDSRDTGFAVTAAFYQWYASEERVESYYVSTCSDYLDRQDDSHAIPSYRLIPAGFFDRLCSLPDGTPYDCADPGRGGK